MSLTNVAYKVPKPNRFDHPRYGINVDSMRVGYAKPGTLPKDRRFLATKLVVKGFSYGRDEKAIREVAAQRILSIIAPDMAVPIARKRDVKGNPQPVVVMRWAKGGRDSGWPNGEYGKEQLEREYGIMKVFDLVIYNSDRHSGNWIVGREHLIPIDHESTFDHPLVDYTMEDFRRKFSSLNRRNMEGVLLACDAFDRNAERVVRLLTVGKRADGSGTQRYRAKQLRGWIAKCRKAAHKTIKAEGYTV